MGVEHTTATGRAGARVRVLYRCHSCSQGSHLVEVPVTEQPGRFNQDVSSVIQHHHAEMSPACGATRFPVKFVDPPPT